jgi:hypothetical protein
MTNVHTVPRSRVRQVICLLHLQTGTAVHFTVKCTETLILTDCMFLQQCCWTVKSSGVCTRFLMSRRTAVPSSAESYLANSQHSSWPAWLCTWRHCNPAKHQEYNNNKAVVADVSVVLKVVDEICSSHHPHKQKSKDWPRRWRHYRCLGTTSPATCPNTAEHCWINKYCTWGNLLEVLVLEYELVLWQPEGCGRW